MEPFRTLTSVAAPLAESNIDTDIIVPARFLLLPDKKGLGAVLFNERRNRRPGANARFVLDQPPFDRARILVAGANFGVGSSREQAVWALSDFGIRCVIAPSFGEIFFANCFKSGLLPVVVPERAIGAVMAEAEAQREITIDLEAQCVRLGDGRALGFEIDPYRKRALLLGLDEIGSVLADDAADIAEFEGRQREQSPWLYLTPQTLSFFEDIEDRDTAAEGQGSTAAGMEPRP